MLAEVRLSDDRTVSDTVGDFLGDVYSTITRQ